MKYGSFRQPFSQGSSVVEQRTHKPLVASSILAPGTIFISRLRKPGRKPGFSLCHFWATFRVLVAAALHHAAKATRSDPELSEVVPRNVTLAHGECVEFVPDRLDPQWSFTPPRRSHHGD